VIPSMIHKCYLAKLNNKPLQLLGTGGALRQFIFSHDFGRILIALLTVPSEQITFSNVILCDEDGPELSIKYVAEQVSKAMNFSGDITWDTTKSDGIIKKTASGAVLKQFLGPEFQFIQFEEGIKIACEWFEKNYEIARK